jgi:Fe-S-cluster containining protein
MMRQLIPEEACLKCRGCCRFSDTESIWSPNLLDDDTQALLKNGIPPFFILDNKKIRLTHYLPENNFICSLFDAGSNKCKAYAFRPFECRLYPFLINRSNGKVFLAADLKCPSLKGKEKSEALQFHAQYLADFLSQPDILKILRRNAHIIQEYEGVLDLVELKL